MLYNLSNNKNGYFLFVLFKHLTYPKFKTSYRMAVPGYSICSYEQFEKLQISGSGDYYYFRKRQEIRRACGVRVRLCFVDKTPCQAVCLLFILINYAGLLCREVEYCNFCSCPKSERSKNICA
jgi:hypothetical protein